MLNKLDLCRTVAASDERAFVGALLGTKIPDGREEECTMIVEALAQSAPSYFIKSVGMYLYENPEVA